MSTNDLLWALVGLISGIAVSFVIIEPLWRSLTPLDNAFKRNRVVVVAVGALFATTAFGLYAYLGEPKLVAEARPDGPALAAHERMPTERDSRAGSMTVATANLQQKLARGEGTDADWALLAQAYEFLGEAAAAQQARNHQLIQVQSAMPLAPPAEATQTLGAANKRRLARDFAGAQRLYEQAIAQHSMTADAWADYADTLASQSQSRLSGVPATAIEAALRADQNHRKALWLSATLALQEQRYADALSGWQRLRALLPADSLDAKVIEANISEARGLLGNDALRVNRLAPCSTSSQKQVCGTVDVTATLKKNLSKDMTLFVYAKARQSPGPPVAVFRSPVTAWPMQFVLSDASAMVPTRRLSDFDDVVIEARLSRSGQALAERGDLQAVGATIHPDSTDAVALLISKVVE